MGTVGSCRSSTAGRWAMAAVTRHKKKEEIGLRMSYEPLDDQINGPEIMCFSLKTSECSLDISIKNRTIGIQPCTDLLAVCLPVTFSVFSGASASRIRPSWTVAHENLFHTYPFGWVQGLDSNLLGPQVGVVRQHTRCKASPVQHGAASPSLLSSSPSVAFTDPAKTPTNPLSKPRSRATRRRIHGRRRRRRPSPAFAPAPVLP